MNLLNKLLKKHGPGYCRECKVETDIILKQLYFMPKTGSEKMPDHDDDLYFLNKLQPINSKSDIPTGYCGAGLKRYRCPSCSKTRDYIEVFMPVRGEERFITGYHFKNGELNSIKTL